MIALTVWPGNPTVAWGDLGHEVTAIIAYRHLTPAARATLDALLTSDTDVLTAPDFVSRSTWADKYRRGHRETAAWHFVDIEIDAPDLAAACFGFTGLATGQPASAGPARDCIVNKVDQFAAELADGGTPPAERLLALKFLVHLLGDLHQPLHASDHRDRGGNCVGLEPAAGGREGNLHAFWDVTVVAEGGDSALQIADRLDASITAKDMKDWTDGTSHSWAMETFGVGKTAAYALADPPSCDTGVSIVLPPAYAAEAREVAAMQLRKAAIRMAGSLNRVLMPLDQWPLGH